MSLLLDLSLIDRERAVSAWLAYHGISKADLARQIGVDPSFITYVLQGKRRSRRIHALLVDLGVPGELLPDPGNGPGRPRKTPAADTPQAKDAKTPGS
ncbi:hypothetical protein dsx2_2688 [Desulfovibrio sp. X2]|uniref:hypothetical protein n=1 Tax=Desulfovibrio sp. X2 TaxID=941449 RepID=UPI0003586D7F|nr:hypothetical protein [Desulfovibrio sp. X2]EPR42771.1 hypothetical protein dsx2_2688 [Desulfovibrio sp. X2]